VILTLHSPPATPVRPHPPRPRAPLPGGPRPAPGATAIRNPTGCPAGSWFGRARWAPRQLSGRGHWQSDRGPERVAPPALAQRRSGTPPVAQPGRGHPSRTGARVGPLAADCSSSALSGTLPALARCDPEPHRLPGRVGGSSRTSAFSHRLRLAADCSSPASSGPLLALARCDPEPHRLPGRVGESSCASAFSHRLRLAADCSSPASSGPLLALAPVARSSRQVEPHVSLQSPVRRSASPAGRRVSTVGHECRTESNRASSVAPAHSTPPALLLRRS
jgi:hypothetical protein